jgi:hypothetical protein
MDEGATEPLMEEPETILQPPSQQGGRKVKYPCLGCGKNVSGASVKCTLCEIWCHKTCANLSAEAYKGLMVQAKEVGTAFWSCRACMGFAQKMNKLYQELNKRQDATEVRVNQIDNKANNNEQEIFKLRHELKRALDKIEDDRQGNNDILCDELRERDLRKLNLVIHGLSEPNMNIGQNRERIEADRRICGELFATIGVRTGGGDLRFCRRIGERGRDARPIVIGLRTEEERRIILERARGLRGGRFDNVSIVPDLTRMQRRGLDRLSEEAAKRNNNLTADDLAKNLRWLVVGRRGEKRLIKGTEAVHSSRPAAPRLSDFMGATGDSGRRQYDGQAHSSGGQPYRGSYQHGANIPNDVRLQLGGGSHYNIEQQHGGSPPYRDGPQHAEWPQYTVPQYSCGSQHSGAPPYLGESQ